jgi:hypothetical protein
MKSTHSFKTVETVCPVTRGHVPEDGILYFVCLCIASKSHPVVLSSCLWPSFSWPLRMSVSQKWSDHRDFIACQLCGIELIQILHFFLKSFQVQYFTVAILLLFSFHGRVFRCKKCVIKSV